MTNNVLIQKLRFAKIRINTLKSRLEDIKTDKVIKNYGGFKAGMFGVPQSVNVFEQYQKNMDFLREWISKKFASDTNEYMLEYHLQNVVAVIEPYYYGLINGEFTPNDEALECNIGGLSMVSDTIDSVIKAIEDNGSCIDCYECDCCHDGEYIVE